jgi:hypothetical protein
MEWLRFLRAVLPSMGGVRETFSAGTGLAAVISEIFFST